MTRQISGLLLIITFISTSCGPGQQAKEAAQEEVVEVAPITLTKAPESPTYDSASLDLNNVEITVSDSTYSASFDFLVENYELGVQTADAATRGIANSGKGQHIHFIINNGPYSAHYEPAFSKDMEAGYYTILAFLSRSYHESVKNDNSYWIDVIKIGEPEGESNVDLSAQHLFYSRPKGIYKGKDTKKLMLDFFLINTSISENGNKVRATVNGTEFMITEWAPYYVEGLSAGEVTVKLELLDASGNLIPGPFNAVERKVTLE